MSDREEFEQRFPVPAGIYWNDISEQYDALPGAAGFDDVEIYHGQWMGWQAARAQGGQAADMVAWEASALGGKRLFHDKAEAEMSAEVYGGGARPLVYGDTHPQPTLQSNQEDVIALLTNALANIRDTDASAKTLQAMAALALRAAKETCDD